LSYAPRFGRADCIGGACGIIPGVGNVGMAALFCVITAAFAVIAFGAASADRWVIAAASAAIGVWMGTFALAALRRIRR